MQNRETSSQASQARQETSISIAVMGRDLAYIKDQLDQINDKVSNHYVSKEEFEPIKKIVYGLVGLILVGVVGALVGLVLHP